MADWLSQLGGAGGGLAAALVLLLAGLGCGSWVLARLRVQGSRHPVEHALVALVIGLDLIALTGLLVGSWRLPPAALTTGLLTVPALLALRAGWRSAREAGPAVARLRRPLPWLCGLLLAAPVLPTALAPPFGWDDLTYHVEVPSRWLAAGRLEVFADNPYSAFPSAVEILHALAMQVGGIRAPGALTVGVWVLGAALLYRLLRPRCRPLLAFALTLALCWSQLGFMLASESYAESFLGLHALALVALLLRSRAGSESRRGLAAGVLLGGAVGVKLTGGLLAAVALALAARRGALRPTLIAAGVSALIAVPFLLRPVVATGNPTHPYFSEVFDPGNEAAVESSRHHHGIASERYGRRGGPAVLTTPFALSTQGHVFSGNLGWQWVAVLSLGLLGARRAVGRRLLLGALVCYLAWFSSAQQVRFLWPAILLVGLSAGWAASAWTRRARHLAAVALLALSVANVPAARWLHAWSNIQLLTGIGEAPSLATYIYTGTGPGYLPAAGALLELTEDDAKVLLVGDTRGLYVPREHVIGTPLVQARFFTPPERFTDPAEVLAVLRAAGITHVLIGTPPRHPDLLPAAAPRQDLLVQAVNALIAGGELEEAWAANGYRLVAVTSPSP